MPKHQRPLNDRQRRFVEELAKGNSATQAYIAAGYSKQGAESSASQLLRNPKIVAELAGLRAKATDLTAISVARVLQRYWDIATIDANELVEHRRECCRHCWGIGFQYQSTAQEMGRARARWAKKKNRTPGEAFDVQGGVGFAPHRDPNPDCPECFGDGESRVFLKDSRKLSAAARALYAGARVTKEGVEVRSLDRDNALLQVAKHLGMFVERHEHTGEDGGPIQVWTFGDKPVKF